MFIPDSVCAAIVGIVAAVFRSRLKISISGGRD